MKGFDKGGQSSTTPKVAAKPQIYVIEKKLSAQLTVERESISVSVAARCLIALPMTACNTRMKGELPW